MSHRFSIPVPWRHDSRTAWACASALLLAAPTAVADEVPNLLTDSFQASIGTFGISSEPSVELRGDTESGGTVDFDEAVGGGDAFRARLDGQWRFADRHKVRFAAFGLSRSQEQTLDEQIEWGDEVFPVDAKVEFENDFWVIEAVYDYSFLRRENYEIGASIGLHWTSFEASLKAKAESSGGTLTEDIDESASVDAPLPVIGLRGLWSLSHNLWLDAAAQFFALSIGDYDGNLQDYRLFLTWQPRTWLGFGVGYNRFTVDVDVEKDDFNGTLDWTYSGPMAFYSVSF